jgi:hypothetical protein
VRKTRLSIDLLGDPAREVFQRIERRRPAMESVG